MTHFVLLDIVENVIVLSTSIVLVPKWVLQGKNFAAQFFIEKYL